MRADRLKGAPTGTEFAPGFMQFAVVFNKDAFSKVIKNEFCRTNKRIIGKHQPGV